MSLSEPSELTPGQQLSAARKSQGKTLIQISEDTRIFESRLEAIERDEYSLAGTAPPFVVGYVKAYAKHVGVAEKPLVGVIEAYFKQKKLIDERDNPVAPPRKMINWTPWLASAVALAIFMALGQWFFASQQEGLADDNDVGEQKVSPSIETAVTSAEVREKRVPLTQRDENLISRNLVTSVESSKKTVLDLGSTGDVSVSLNTQDSAKSTVLQKQDELVKLQNLQVEDGSAPNDALKLVFSADCWVEVVDANGRKRVAKLAKAGDEIKLVGKAPFDLKVGDATAVEGFVNGRLLELKARPGRRVLRIQVGP